MKTTCTADNAKDFNQMLKATLPAFHALAMQLFQTGLITGLRGATLIIHDRQHPTEQDNTPPPSNASAAFCKDCRHYRPDPAGYGGAGQCAVNGYKHKLYWPHQEACSKWQSTSC